MKKNKTVEKYWGNRQPQPTVAQEFERWQNLANATIKRAVKDFRHLAKKVLNVEKTEDERKTALVELTDIVEFFGSDRFRFLAMSSVGGDKVLLILQEEIISGKKYEG